MKRFCALNIGNTHTDYAVGSFESDGRVRWEIVRKFDTSAIPFAELPIDVFMVYASVVPRITEILKKKFPDAVGCIAQNVGMIDFSDAPPTVGMDRIANCAALAAKSNSGIVIDVGTAITLEVVANKKFIGGAILPGTAIMAKAMHDHTGALPLVEIPGTPDMKTVSPALKTVDAMQLGIQSAAVGGVLCLLENFLKLLPENSPVYVCGGNRQLILSQQTSFDLIDSGDDFTLRGIAAVADYHL